MYTEGEGPICKCTGQYTLEGSVHCVTITLQERQCTPKGQARYVNVRGSVHWKGVYRVGDRDLGMHNFFNWFLKLTNQKRPKVTCLVRHLD